MSKAWYQSTTIQGSIVSALGILINYLHLPVGSDELSAVVSAFLLVAGVVASVYGRLKTKGEAITVK